MGMFDDLKVEIELPDYNGPSDNFQTKSLDRAMDGFTINKEGRLIHHTTKWVDVSEDEKKHEFHLFNVESTGNVDRNYHGWINFYTIVGNDPELTEFNAKFTDGCLVEVQNVKTGTIRRYNDSSNKT